VQHFGIMQTEYLSSILTIEKNVHDEEVDGLVDISAYCTTSGSLT